MKEVVITGGSGGLGSAIAARFRELGWAVLAPSRVELDVTDAVQVRRYFEQTSPELLICAAGMTRDALLLRATESDWDAVMDVNFRGAASCAQAVIAGMVERGHGHLVFISSHSALHPPVGQAAYAASKAALLGLTRDLAKLHGHQNVRINAILPGFLETKMTRTVPELRVNEVRDVHVLPRFNTVEAVANFIHFLHDQLPHTSGQVFQLDSRAE